MNKFMDTIIVIVLSLATLGLTSLTVVIVLGCLKEMGYL